MKKLNIVIFFGIVVLSFYFRFQNLNWDHGFHLHPDERFLTMVGVAMKIPQTIENYLNPHTSLANPSNIGFSFYVYGIFPVVMTKIIAVITHRDVYDSFTIIGRQLSAFIDCLTVIVVFKLVSLWDQNYHLKKDIKYWAAFLYATLVLPIQLSHFFAMDTFLNFFMLIGFYYVQKWYFKTKIFYITLSGIFFGLAIASKLTAVFILPLYCIFFLINFFKSVKYKKSMIKIAISTVIFFLVAYVTIRLADPYLFESNSIFNFTISKLFIANIAQLKSWDRPDIWFPPGVQWATKTSTFSLINLAVFGVGIPAFIFIIIGMLRIIYKFKSKLFIVLLWVLGCFVYQSIQYVKVMRYFIFVYPFLAIFGGIGIVFVLSVFKKYILSNVRRSIFYVLLVFCLLIWPLMFQSIYIQTHSRIAASDWIYKNVPNNALILSEHWDDGLPLPVSKSYGKQFRSDQLPVFDPDTPEKFQKMHDLLLRADYYILSSNRGWGSIPTVPEKYPMMTKFYTDLLHNRTAYKKVAEFTSYPQLCYMLYATCFMFSDQWAEESFTVYDHPKVMIYQNKNKTTL